MIDYTGKVVVSEKEERRRIGKEIKRVKDLTSKCALWYLSFVPEDFDLKNIWYLESPNRMIEINTKVEEKMREQHKIKMCW